MEMLFSGKLVIDGQSEYPFRLSASDLEAVLQLVAPAGDENGRGAIGMAPPQRVGSPTDMTDRERAQAERAQDRRIVNVQKADGLRAPKKKKRNMSVETAMELIRLLVQGYGSPEIALYLGITEDVVQGVRSGFSWQWLSGFVPAHDRVPEDLYDSKYFGWDPETVKPKTEALKRMRHRMTRYPSGKMAIRYKNPWLEMSAAGGKGGA